MNNTIRRHNTVASGCAFFRKSGSYDYEDSFTIKLNRIDVESWEPVAAFFQSSPHWVVNLMALRNRIVKVFGLKVGIENVDTAPPFKAGQSFGAVQLYSISDDEAVIGEADRHLDFKVSFLLRANGSSELTLSTVVCINNILGKMYMFFVKPAHRLIVPAMLQRMAHDIDSRSLIQHQNRELNCARN